MENNKNVNEVKEVKPVEVKRRSLDNILNDMSEGLVFEKLLSESLKQMKF